MDYKSRFKVILRELGLNGREYCELHLMDYSYYRKCTQPKGRYVANWIKSFVICYDQINKLTKTE